MVEKNSGSGMTINPNHRDERIVNTQVNSNAQVNKSQFNPVLTMSRADALRVGQSIAPGFDFPLLSKCLRPYVYGIMPVESIAEKIFVKRAVRENRKLGYQLTWRCDTALKLRLQTVKSHYAIATDQEIITLAVLMLCEHDERKRRNV